MQRQRAIRLGWEEFVKTGRPPQRLPQTLLASWARSQTCGVPVGRREAPLSGEIEIFRRRVKNVDLVTAARPRSKDPAISSSALHR